MQSLRHNFNFRTATVATAIGVARLSGSECAGVRVIDGNWYSEGTMSTKDQNNPTIAKEANRTAL
jgi:hypothetical protein